MASFVEELPRLLRLLADPTTPHTAPEVWCRIQTAGWEACVPVLLSALEGGDADVKRLVLEVLAEACEHVGVESTEPFHAAVERLLSDEDRLVRIAAVHSAGCLGITNSSALAALRRIACQDELPLARQALVTLIELDDEAVEQIRQMFREPSA